MENFKKSFLIFAFAVCVFVIFFVSACSNLSNDGTAAIVNGIKISEDQVSEKVMEYRKAYNLLDDQAWQKHLKDNKSSSKKVRNEYLEKLIELELYKQTAEDYGITAADDDSIVAKVRHQFVVDAATPKDAYSKLLVLYGEKLNGSKGYYQLMYKKSDEARAKQDLANIKSGKLSFLDANAQLMATDTDGVNFDYVIYDCMIQNKEPCTKALAGMHPGQISDLIYLEDYICVFNVVDEISCEVPLSSFSSLSEFTQNNLKYYAKIMDGQNVADDAFKKIKKEASITKYDMPQGLPY